MLRDVVVLAGTLALVTGAVAQDIPSLQRTIDRLSTPPSAEELTELGAKNPNAYIYFLQDFLKDAGGYGGPLSGQLTNATIGAIVGFCRQAGFAETCIRGPMLPQSIAAVSNAVAAALTPAAEATPAAAAAPTPAETDGLPSLPEGWMLNDNGGRGSLGLDVVVISAGPEEAVIRLSGTAASRGYFNIQLSPRLDSTPARWMTQVSAQRESLAGTAGEISFGTALMGDKAYLGELFPRVPITDGATMTALNGSGVPPADTLQIVPYVQLWVKEGDRVDTTIHLADPSIGETP